MNVVVMILPDGRTFEAAKGEFLAGVLEKAGLSLSLYCGRRGLCGKCIVEIIQGPLAIPGDEEHELLARRRWPANFRLACRYRITDNLTVRIPETSLLPRMPVLSQGVARTFSLEPAVKKIRLHLPRPDLACPQSLADLLLDRFPRLVPIVSSAVLGKLAGAWAEAGPSGEVTAVVYKNAEILTVEAGDTTDRAFGIAVDLGTTTLVVELVDLVTGSVLESAAGLNAQSRFGADVVTRITAAYSDPGKAERLREVVVNSVNGLVQELLDKHRVSPDLVYEVVVAGNTAMNHLFLGLPVSTLAVAPYHALFSGLPSVPMSEIGLGLNPRGRVYFAPNIMSFVGGDISAGLTAIDAGHQPGNFLFVDLGTNGEIVLKKGTRFVTTSTAAGPAFEGMTISCGMLALPGAVFKAELDGSRVAVQTIAGHPARGICGTGLIDLIALSLQRGLVSPQGHILDSSKRIPVADGLDLIQKDIREVQLAAAAVKTGIRMLLAENDLTVRKLGTIYVAGAFGNYLNIPNAMALGLLPRAAAAKIKFIGNSSLAGARAMLLSRLERDQGESLVRKIRHVSLAKGSNFQTMFVDGLEFKEWE